MREFAPVSRRRPAAQFHEAVFKTGVAELRVAERPQQPAFIGLERSLADELFHRRTVEPIDRRLNFHRQPRRNIAHHLQPHRAGQPLPERHRDHRGIKTPCLILQLFPFPAVFDARPRCDRPVVIELPEKRSHAARLERPPIFHTGLDRQRLLHLRQIEEIRESFRHPEIFAEHPDDRRIALVTFLVVIHHRREHVELILRTERLHRLQRRKRLEPEFRTETRLHLVIRIEILPAMPHLPVVHVAAGVVVPAVVEIIRPAARRTRPEHPFRITRLDHAEQFTVEPVIVNEVCRALFRAIPAGGADHLVVAAPDRQRCVMTQPLDLKFQFETDVLDELRRRWINRTREHHILPDHDPLAVTEFVEDLMFILAAAPDPEHVHIGQPGRFDQILVNRRRLARRERIHRNPVRTLAENIHAVDAEIHRCSEFIRLIDHLHRPQTDLNFPAFVGGLHRERIERRVAVTIRPPEFRIMHVEDGLDDVGSAFERDLHFALFAVEAELH